MRYEQFRYLWPPRPPENRKVSPPRVSEYEEKGWWAQAKLNGDCLVLAIDPDRVIHARTRHGPEEIPGRWAPGRRLRAFAETLPGRGYYVFLAELMDKPARGVVDTVYLFELLVDDGEYLVGETFRERQWRLDSLCEEKTAGPWTHVEVMDGVWRARNHESGFDQLVAQCSGIAEGLVFKNPLAPLSLCVSPASNTAWQVKCRVTNPHVSY